MGIILERGFNEKDIVTQTISFYKKSLEICKTYKHTELIIRYLLANKLELGLCNYWHYNVYEAFNCNYEEELKCLVSNIEKINNLKTTEKEPYFCDVPLLVEKRKNNKLMSTVKDVNYIYNSLEKRIDYLLKYLQHLDEKN